LAAWAIHCPTNADQVNADLLKFLKSVQQARPRAFSLEFLRRADSGLEFFIGDPNGRKLGRVGPLRSHLLPKASHKWTELPRSNAALSAPKKTLLFPGVEFCEETCTDCFARSLNFPITSGRSVDRRRPKPNVPFFVRKGLGESRFIRPSALDEDSDCACQGRPQFTGDIQHELGSPGADAASV